MVIIKAEYSKDVLFKSGANKKKSHVDKIKEHVNYLVSICINL